MQQIIAVWRSFWFWILLGLIQADKYMNSPKQFQMVLHLVIGHISNEFSMVMAKKRRVLFFLYTFSINQEYIKLPEY